MVIIMSMVLLFFPHNIGLGAANNPGPIAKIGEVTALEVAAYRNRHHLCTHGSYTEIIDGGAFMKGYSESSDITFDYSAIVGSSMVMQVDCALTRKY